MIVSFLWVYDDDETQVVVVVCGAMIEREVRFIDWNKLNRIFMCLIFEHFYYFFNNQFLKEKISNFPHGLAIKIKFIVLQLSTPNENWLFFLPLLE